MSIKSKISQAFSLLPYAHWIAAYKFRLLRNKSRHLNPPVGFSLLMITYNRAAFLERSLEAIAAATKGPFEIIILDNNSSDNTSAVVQSFQSAYPKVELKYIKENYNFGTNGYALAFLASKYKYIVDLDDDILAIQKNWDENVIRAFSDFEDIGFLSLDVVQDEFTEGAKPPMENYTRITQNNTTIQKGPAGGWFAITERKTYYELGGFVFRPDKPFRMEDGAYSHKARQRNLICGILEGTKVYHASGPVWNAKGNFQKVWKEKYGKDFLGAVNMVDNIDASKLPDWSVPKKSIDAL